MAAGVHTEPNWSTPALAQRGKTSPCSTGSFSWDCSSLWTKTRFLLSPADIRELYFHPSASGCSLVCVLLSLSIIVTARCRFPLASVLSYLTLNDTQTDGKTDRQTHKPQKQTESRHLHSQHRVEKKVNGLELLWAVVKELCRKRIKTLNLMCGQLNQTGIFFF